MEQSLISAFNWNFWYDPETSMEGGIDKSTSLLYENIMIGRARIRQVGAMIVLWIFILIKNIPLDFYMCEQINFFKSR